MNKTNQFEKRIIVDKKTKIYINKLSCDIIKKYNGAWRKVLSYHNFESFLKMLPGNIIKNSDDIKTIKDIQEKLDFYLKEIVPQILDKNKFQTLKEV